MDLKRVFSTLLACLCAAACNQSENTDVNRSDAAELSNNVADQSTDPAAQGAPAESSTTELRVTMAEKAGAGRCPIFRNEGWRAAVATGPDGARTLLLIGFVWTNTGGYDVNLEPGALDRLDPPNQRFELNVREPSGLVTQQPERHPVFARVPGQPSYSSVIVFCRGREIERIANIPQLPPRILEPRS